MNAQRLDTARIREPKDVYRTAAHAAWVMLALNATLSVGKGVVGWLGGSYALLADGANNLTDAGLSLALVIGMKWAGRPPDRRHPYGHGKMETEVARLVGIVVLATAGFIAAGALRQWGSADRSPGMLVLVVAAVGMVVKEAMFRAQRRLAQRLGSLALEADALNHRTDAAATFCVLIGVALSRYGGPAWRIADNIAALVVAGMMGYGAARVVFLASREMLDEMPPSDALDAVRRVACEMEDVSGVEKLIGRKMGAYYVLDLHLEVAPSMTVREAHYLGHRVRDAILDEVPSVADVLVHIEPAFREDAEMRAAASCDSRS